MLTIRAMTGGVGYARRHLEHSDYYDDERRIQGQWHGRGAGFAHTLIATALCIRSLRRRSGQQLIRDQKVEGSSCGFLDLFDWQSCIAGQATQRTIKMNVGCVNERKGLHRFESAAWTASRKIRGPWAEWFLTSLLCSRTPGLPASIL
jgi:hypothetical protein